MELMVYGCILSWPKRTGWHWPARRPSRPRTTRPCRLMPLRWAWRRPGATILRLYWPKPGRPTLRAPTIPYGIQSLAPGHLPGLPNLASSLLAWLQASREVYRERANQMEPTRWVAVAVVGVEVGLGGGRRLRPRA